MTGTIASVAPKATRLRNEADALWERYRSTVCTCGTPEQRRWAFSRALAAEEIAARAECLTATPNVAKPIAAA